MRKTLRVPLFILIISTMLLVTPASAGPISTSMDSIPAGWYTNTIGNATIAINSEGGDNYLTLTVLPQTGEPLGYQLAEVAELPTGGGINAPTSHYPDPGGCAPLNYIMRSHGHNPAGGSAGVTWWNGLDFYQADPFAGHVEAGFSYRHFGQGVGLVAYFYDTDLGVTEFVQVPVDPSQWTAVTINWCADANGAQVFSYVANGEVVWTYTATQNYGPMSIETWADNQTIHGINPGVVRVTKEFSIDITELSAPK